MSPMDQHPSTFGKFGDLTRGSDGSSSDSLEHHQEKWPAGVAGGRISVSPPDNIARILELSPPAAEFEEREQYDEDSPDSTGVYRSTICLRTPPNTPKRKRESSSTNCSSKNNSDLEGGRDTDALILQKDEPSAGVLAHQIENGSLPSSIIRLTRRQILVVSVLGLVTLTSSFAVCLFPPFFPKIAQKKGCSITVFGFIIGTNCLVAFLVTPTVGKNLERIGVKFCFVMGAMASGVCCILSGFLEWFPPGKVFVLEAVLIRAVHACSNAFVITSTFAFIVVEFPGHIAKLFALTRTTMNLAQMLGPVVGGALYEIGGFKMPFLVLGSVQIFVAFCCIWALPCYIQKPAEKNPKSNVEVSLLNVIRIPGIWISFCTFIFSTMSNGFLSITLEPLVLRQLDISYLHVGFLFGLKDGANSLASPVWGYLCDKYKALRPFILISTVMAASSFLLLGSLPYIPLQFMEAVIVLALIINGFGIGGQQVAGVVHAMKMAVGANLPDDAVTHGFIAGLWSSVSGAGRFISRAGSGFVTDHIGFQYSTIIVVLLHSVVFIVTLSFMIVESADVCCTSSSAPTTEEYNTEEEDDVPTDRGLCRVVLCNNSPSDPIGTKAIKVPSMRDTIEGSTNYGSMGSMERSPLFIRSPRCVT